MSFLNVRNYLFSSPKIILGILRNSSSSSTTSENNGERKDGKENINQVRETNGEIKQLILEASLKFVPQYGWSSLALAEGAESIGLSKASQGLFNSGGFALVDYFTKDCDRRLDELLTNKPATNPWESTYLAIQSRLNMLLPYIKIWPEALALELKPNNVSISLKNRLQLADLIVYKAAGDRSVNWRWYNNRFLILGLYQSTEIYLIQDSSPNQEETWSFLSRRIKDASEVQQTADNVANKLDISGETVSAAAITMRNLIGLNK